MTHPQRYRLFPTFPPGVEWTIMGLLVLLLAFIGWMVFRDRGFQPSGPASGPIGFKAFRPACGDALYDRKGRPAGEALYDGAILPPWATNQIQCGFLFTLPAGRPGRWQGTCLIRASASQKHLVTVPLEVKRALDGSTEFEVESPLPRHVLQPFLLFWQQREELRQVDLNVYYHDTSGLQNEVVFKGPFEIGTRHRQGDWTLRRVEPNRESTNLVAFRIEQDPAQTTSPVPIFLLTDGSRVTTLSTRSSLSSGQSVLECVILSPSSEPVISEVRIPRQFHAEFRDVTVSHRRWGYRAYPAMFDQVGQRTGMTNVEARVRTGRGWIPNADAALRCLEALRGPYILKGWHTLKTTYPPQPGCNAWSSLPAAQQARIRETARTWTNCASAPIRLAGAAMGMAGSWPEFVAPTLELIGLQDSAVTPEAEKWLQQQASCLGPEALRVILNHLQDMKVQTPAAARRLATGLLTEDMQRAHPEFVEALGAWLDNLESLPEER